MNKVNDKINNLSYGFSLIEIVAVIALMAIMATVVIPKLSKRRIQLKKEFLNQLNSLTRTAQLDSILTGKSHRIFFDFQKRIVRIERMEKIDGEDKFKPLDVPYGLNSYPINEKLELEKFTVKGKATGRMGEEKILTAYYVITPEGLAQEVEMEFFDQESRFTFVMNPFLARLSYG